MKKGRAGGKKLNPAFQRRAVATSSGVSEALLKQARQSGQLNLSNRSLESVPSSVWRLNVDQPADSSVSFGAAGGRGEDNWWEQVDLIKLILAGNQLTELSEEIQHLPALNVLDAHDNRLTSLPSAIGSLENLARLVLSHNNLCSLEASVTALTNLKQLKLDNNSLTHLPATLGQLLHLEELDLSGNKLTSLPSSIGDMSSLKILSVSHNTLASLPESLGQLRELKTLSVHNNKLTEFPPLSGVSQLIVVEAQYNLLTSLPLIQSGASLVQLHVGFNKLTTVEIDKLSPLTSLMHLDLRDNKISTIPDEIVQLSTLERLDLTNNSLSTLPYMMGNMSALKSVQLEGNTMRGIRRDILNRGTMEVLKYLRSRIPSDTPLEEPQHHSTKFTPTKQPSSSQRTPPPTRLCEQEQITELTLGCNQLKIVPPEIGRLTRVTVLDLRNNLLSTLPSELAQCTRLVDVVISFNRFTELPSVLYTLGKLENIIASDNQISSIDVSGLSRIPGLACLDLQNNNIGQIPPQVGTLTTLKHLQLGGNPFRVPRSTVLTKGTAFLLEYLRDRIPT